MTETSISSGDRLAKEKPSWPRAFGLAAGATYVPLLVMCLYTTAFVDCSHCKTHCWVVAPFAPGIFFWMLARHFVELSHETGLWGILATGILTLLLLVGVAAVVRGVGRWCWLVLVLVMIATSLLAVGMFNLLRA